MAELELTDINQISTVGIHIVLNLGVNRLGWDRHVWDIRLDVIEGLYLVRSSQRVAESLQVP
jgi:hypothetical protein